MTVFPLVTGAVCTLQASQTVTSVTVAGGSSTPGGPITFLTAAPHGLVAGDLVSALLAGGSGSMEGVPLYSVWSVAVADSAHFSLVGSNGVQTGAGGGGTYVHVGHLYPPTEVDLSADVTPGSGVPLKIAVSALNVPCRVQILESVVSGAGLSSWCLATFDFPAGVTLDSPDDVSGAASTLSDSRLLAAGGTPLEFLYVAVLFRSATVGGTAAAPGSSLAFSVWLG
jgi:hypothetical protein